MSGAYYNENNRFAAAWLRELIKEKLIADGEVDERSIADVHAADVRGFVQCHWFAGVGGWSYALRLAGWPDTREVWTGSCPCQKFSSATRGRATAADLWPEFRRLIVDARPGIVFGEQVATAGDWFDGVCDDVEAVGYEVGAAVLPATSVGADHARARMYFACHADTHGQSRRAVHEEASRLQRDRSLAGIMVSTHGISRDVVALSGFGNAIVPAVGAAFVSAYLDVRASEKET